METYLDFVHEFFREKIDPETADEVVETFKTYSEVLFFELDKDVLVPSLMMAAVFKLIEHGDEFMEILMATGIPQIRKYKDVTDILRDIPPRMRGAIIAGILVNRIPDITSWIEGVHRIRDELMTKGTITPIKIRKIIYNVFDEAGNLKDAPEAYKMFIKYLNEILEEVSPRIYQSTHVLADIATALVIMLVDREPELIPHLVGFRF